MNRMSASFFLIYTVYSTYTVVLYSTFQYFSHFSAGLSLVDGQLALISDEAWGTDISMATQTRLLL